MGLLLVIAGQSMSAESSSPNLPGAYLLELVKLVARWDVSSEQLLAGTPWSEAQLAEPTTRVPLSDAAELADRAITLTREPALAVYLGLSMPVSAHGFLGFAAMMAPTLRQALELAERYSATRTTALSVRLEVAGETSALVIEESADFAEFRAFVVLSLMVGLQQIGQSLTGQELEGHAECAFPEPEFLSDLPQQFAEQTLFECPVSRLVFPTATLELPIRSADPAALKLAQSQCERELAALIDAGLVARVRQVLAEDLSVTPSLEQVARTLGQSSRTLKRKLAEQGSSFSVIADELRRQHALLLLDDRSLSISEIAGQLGYREVASFNRAFRRWTQTSPKAFRDR